MKHTGTSPVKRSAIISDIINADIFRNLQMEFCCAGKKSLQQAGEGKRIEASITQKKSDHTAQKVYLSNDLDYNDWSIEFLTEYIVNIHHECLRKTLPAAQELLACFAEDYLQKYPCIIELKASFDNIVKEILPVVVTEQEIIFPYFRQVVHAYNSKAPYAALLVRTLRKPFKNMTRGAHQSVYKNLLRIRELSNQYSAPEDASADHQAVFLKLNEIDDDLIQQLYLETSVLFPKVIALEKELLEIG